MTDSLEKIMNQLDQWDIGLIIQSLQLKKKHCKKEITNIRATQNITTSDLMEIGLIETEIENIDLVIKKVRINFPF